MGGAPFIGNPGWPVAGEFTVICDLGNLERMA
jgi:hypothetical protein